MRKRGIKRGDSGCCPGHDKFPRESYNNRVSVIKKRRTDQLANMRARRWDRQIIQQEIEQL